MLKLKININCHLTMQVIYVLLLTLLFYFRPCLVLKKIERKCKEKIERKIRRHEKNEGN